MSDRLSEPCSCEREGEDASSVRLALGLADAGDDAEINVKCLCGLEEDVGFA